MEEQKTFEQSIGELENILKRLENQDTPLDEAMQLFEQGVKLSDYCAGLLEQARQKVSILVERDGKMQKEDFAGNEE